MRNLPGFIPVTYHKVGYVLIAIGFIVTDLKIIDWLIDWGVIPTWFLYFGLALLLLSLYLIRVVPREDQ